MKKLLLAVTLAVHAAVSFAAVGTAKPAPKVTDETLATFFSRDAHHTKDAFGSITDKALRREVFTMMLTENAATLQPVFQENGFSIAPDDLAEVIADARSLGTDRDALVLEKEAKKRAEEERVARLIEEQRRKAEETARRATEGDGGHFFDGGPVKNSQPLLGPEAGGLTLKAMVGGGAAGDKGLISYGLMGRYGFPLNEGKLGNFGPEFGFVHTFHSGGHDENLGDRTVYTSSDGEYKVVDYANRDFHDSLHLFTIGGLSYQTPSIKKDGQNFVNFEIGGRGGIGSVNNEVTRTDGEREEMVVYHGGPHWETMSDGKSTRTESGGRTTAVFTTAFAAANVAVAEDLSLHLEVERMFLGALNTHDATVGRVGLQWKF